MHSIITRSYYPHGSAISTKISAVAGGPFDEVGGWNVAFTLREGESRIVWLFALISMIMPVTWPVRVTNIGNGTYRISRPFPWLLGNDGEVCQAVKPTAITERTTYGAVLA